MKKTQLITMFLLIATTISFAQGYRVNRTNERTKAKIKSAGLGKNIIAFSPMNVAVNSMMSDGNANVAVGFSYERIFNNEYIGIKLPVNFTITKPGVFFMPTIKLYPKKQGAVKYAVGPQFLISFVEDRYTSYYYSQGVGFYKDWQGTRRQFGFALNNSLNFTISKSMYIGMDASLGILYYDSFTDQMNNNGNMYNNDVVGMDLNQSFSAGFCMGFRF